MMTFDPPNLGLYMVNEMEKEAYTVIKVDKPMWATEDTPLTREAVENTLKIPDHLKCPVCDDLFKDAVMMPSCACCLCDLCARDALIKEENVKNECPVCDEPDNSPDDLIPVRQTREEVKKFRNSHLDAFKAVANNSKEGTPSRQLSGPGGKPTLPDIKLPDLTSSEGQFDALAQVKKSSLSPVQQQQQPEDSPVYDGFSVTSTPSDDGDNEKRHPLTGELLPPGVEDSSELSFRNDKSKSKSRTPGSTPSPSRSRSRTPGSPTRDEKTSPSRIDSGNAKNNIPDLSRPPPSFDRKALLPHPDGKPLPTQVNKIV